VKDPDEQPPLVVVATAIEHLQQPEGSNLCAHCCVAMALGLTLDEAIARVGHKHGTRNHELVRALGTIGKFQPGRHFTDPSIVRVKGEKSRRHVALVAGGKVYDPAYSKPAPSIADWVTFVENCAGWRIVSHFKLGGVDERPKTTARGFRSRESRGWLVNS
jgi:hypothetical protein